ncbi:MAG: hypothetical protein ABSG31_16140 [Tepidisphaeraceae bacterium]|jgi:hypothetical protein
MEKKFEKYYNEKVLPLLGAEGKWHSLYTFGSGGGDFYVAMMDYSKKVQREYLPKIDEAALADEDVVHVDAETFRVDYLIFFKQGFVLKVPADGSGLLIRHMMVDERARFASVIADLLPNH